MPNPKLSVGNNAPDFMLKDHSGKEVSLKEFKGKWVVLYFYPKDDTPGCTIEANEFTRFSFEFQKLNAVILGISPDTCESHQKFMQKYSLTITLLSDTEHKALEKYGVWQLKKKYGKEYMGVVRTTYLINPDGKIAHVWEKVSVDSHAEDVLMRLKEST